MARVNVIYHHYPHYRAPILRELAVNGFHQYRFFGSLESVSGIKSFQGDDLVKITPLHFSFKGNRWILKGYWPAVFDRSADAVIVIGNPNMPASWLIAAVGRLIGKKTFFWAHGWLKPEARSKRFIRNLYFGLATKVLVYGERAKLMAIRAGFASEKVLVIYNSLDFDRSQLALRKIELGESDNDIRPQSLFINPSRPVIICTARVTALCRFDLLFEAAAMLKTAGRPVNVLLVGDGPEREALEDLAKQLGIDVHFYGACYDEDVLANLIYFSDITVSPGKIGLTVIHSLTYGTPAITHGDLDEQMPEVEAIDAGKTGLLFERNNSADLRDKITEWLTHKDSREVIRRHCQKTVLEKWNPKKQRELIDAAVSTALGHGGEK